MLKRTKSANQSVIADAVNNDHTAVTMSGNAQPDEDDYGYVSQEAADFYNKMMEKYNKMPDEPKFPANKKKVNTNLSSIKNDVTAALEREKEEANAPHKRRKKRDSYASEKVDEEEQFEETPPKPKPKPKPAPPPINFTDLLRMAEKKQFEPIVIEKKEVEEERPLTKKQKKELEREKEYLERKTNASHSKPSPNNRIPKLSSNNTNNNNRAIGNIPKLNESNVIKPSSNTKKTSSENKSRLNSETSPNPKSSYDLQKKSTNGIKKREDVQKPLKASDRSKPDDRFKKPMPPSTKPAASSSSYNPSPNRVIKKPEPTKSNNILEKKSYLFDSKQNSVKSTPKPDGLAKRPLTVNNGKAKEYSTTDSKLKQRLSLKSKEIPRNDLKPKEFPPRDMKPKQFPPRDLKTKQFPPPDVRRNGPPKKKMLVQKGNVNLTIIDLI